MRTRYINNLIIDEKSRIITKTSKNKGKLKQERNRYKNVSKDIYGYAPLFFATQGNYSYVKFDNEAIVQIQEKVPISKYASIGLYYFSSWDLYKEGYWMTYKKINGDGWFVAPIYNHFCKNGYRIGYKILERVYILGTPEELHNFDPKFIDNNINTKIAKLWSTIKKLSLNGGRLSYETIYKT